METKEAEDPEFWYTQNPEDIEEDVNKNKTDICYRDFQSLLQRINKLKLNGLRYA